MNRYSKLLLFLMSILNFGCDTDKPSSASSDYMIFDSILYVEQFPKIFELDEATLVNYEIPGVKSIAIRDSLLIVSTNSDNGYWSFFSLPTFNFLGKYINKGNGPIESLISPMVEGQYFHTVNGDLHSLIYDFSTGKLLDFNISQTLLSDSVAIQNLNANQPNSLFNFNVIDDSTFYCTSVNGSHTQQCRYVQHVDKQEVTRNMLTLNNAKISDGGNINALSAISMYDPQSKHIAECAIMLNQINLFSVDDTFALTICYGDMVDKISDVDGRAKKTTYMDINGYDRFFSALYYNQSRGNLKNPSIQFFDWYGKPLFEVKLNKPISSSSIDFENKILYGVDYKTEELYKFDFSDVVDHLKSVKVL